MTGRYSRADAHLKSVTGSGSKVARGWGPMWDSILEHTTPSKVCEIGVGNGYSQLAWAYALPKAEIIGIDVSAPSFNLCKNIDATTKQFQNIMDGIETFYSTINPIPLDVLRRLRILYNRDGYSKEFVTELVNEYGRFDFVTNDGKQQSPVQLEFLDAWRDAITDDGLLVQEKIGRLPESKVDIPGIEKCINTGWLIYDMREYVTFEDPEWQGYLGVWTKNPELWKKRFSHLRLVTDIASVVPERYHGQQPKV